MRQTSEQVDKQPNPEYHSCLRCDGKLHVNKPVAFLLFHYENHAGDFMHLL